MKGEGPYRALYQSQREQRGEMAKLRVCSVHNINSAILTVDIGLRHNSLGKIMCSIINKVCNTKGIAASFEQSVQWQVLQKYETLHSFKHK